MFMDEYEKDFVIDFHNVFMPVERADIFRVLACRYLGGVVRILPPSLKEKLKAILYSSHSYQMIL